MRPAVLALALLVACPPLVRSQTMEEVRKAVDDYFGDDALAEASHAALGRWGNAALPSLRELAGKPSSRGLLDRLMPVRSGDWNIVCAIETIDTAESVELLIEILDDKTAVAPHEALMQLQLATWHHREQLRTHERFEQLVFKFARDASSPLADTNQGTAAGIIADLGWEDGAPLIELMLKAKDLSLRQKAAAALKKLTGQNIELPRAPLAFPARDESELLRLAGTARSDDVHGRFTTWFDGQPTLVGGKGRVLVSLDLDGSELARLDVEPDVWIQDVVALPLADGPRWILQADPGKRNFGAHGEVAIGVDATRRELWRHVPPQRGLVDVVPLYAAEGCIGAVIADEGDGGFHGLDGDGKPLFDVTGLTYAYGLASHPGLPDTWLHWFGDLTLRDNAGHVKSSTRAGLGWSGFWLYASEAVLFPDEDGRPGVVAAGSDADSVPTIVRYDENLRAVWHATVPERIGKLALLDPPGGPRLLAATTVAGELFVFDPDGALRQRIQMQDGHSDNVSTYTLSAGPMSGRRYGLAVGLLWTTLVYELK